MAQASEPEWFDVAVAGAGPVGLTLANLLGQYGVSVLLLEAAERLLDYPRGVGIDDETLRAFQTAGLVDRVLPHTVPNHMTRIVNGRGRVLAEIAPSTEEFGWPRKNGFIQPLIDRVLLEGLERHPAVEVAFAHRVDGFTARPDYVDIIADAPGGSRAIRAGYLVGADGGRSATRRAMGVTFEGQSSPTRWLVVDLRTDPLGTPNAYLGADPARPYVSIGLPHGVRRFEFMLFDKETDVDAERPDFVDSLIGHHLPRPGNLEIIRSRVYTHHSRIAGAFRQGRVLIAGDAAHLMPVWQGQGFNSGVRDAFNLAWKLAAVVSGRAGPDLLDTYDLERRDHALAMIKLSTLMGRVVSPTRRWVAGLRDAAAIGVGAVPALKAYVVGMRFKPMPSYHGGAVVAPRDDDQRGGASPAGRLLIQPRVLLRDGEEVRLDDALGDGFALLAWGNDPAALLDDDARQRLARLGTRLVAVRPKSQLAWPGQDRAEVTVVGDYTGALRALFDAQPNSVLLVRPDRVIAAACPAYRTSDTVRQVCQALHAMAPTSADPPSPPAATTARRRLTALAEPAR